MVAPLGENALGAIALMNLLSWRLRTTMGCLDSGTASLVARHCGAAEFHRAGEVLTHSTLLSVGMGALCLLLIPFAPNIIAAMGAEGSLLSLATACLMVLVSVLPFRIASLNMATALRAAGNARVPMMVTLLINVVNIGINYTLIYGNFGAPKLGVIGAAVGTATAFLLEFCILALLLTRGLIARRFSGGAVAIGKLKFHRSALVPWLPGISQPLLRIAHPTFWEEVVVSIGFIGYGAMVTHCGAVALAAHAAVSRLESFSYNIGFGISIAAATLVGQALGAQNVQQARRSIGICMTLSIALMGALSMAFIAFPEWFLGWFSGPDSAPFLGQAMILFIIAASEQPLLAAAMVLRGALRGSGHTRASFLALLAGTIPIRLGLGSYLAFGCGMGVEGLYWATVVDWSSRVLILGWIVSRGRWERMRE